MFKQDLHEIWQAETKDNTKKSLAGLVEQELKEQAAKLGVNNIHFIGYLSDVEKVALLELCYAVVFPSHLRSEAFSISSLEGA